jgi:endo-1,4-beta-xylanase
MHHTYTLKNLLLLATLFIASCNKKQVATTCDESPLYQKTPYPVGVAVDINKLQTNPEYRNVVIHQFNNLTPENAMKFAEIHPQSNYYDWNQADYLVSFAKQYYKTIHGHTLVWHRTVPTWVDDYTGNWSNILKEHITQVVGRYQHDIYSWDVVNEALNEDGTLRSTVWFNNIGPSYIEQAFKAAHEADPDALLFYNDYNLEFNPTKLDAAIALCNNVRSKGIPVDGIGLQMHMAEAYPTINDLEQAVRKITNAGYKVHFSELDMSMNSYGKKTTFTTQDLNTQAAKFRNVFQLYNQLRPEDRFAITFWGVSDADTWLKSEYNRLDIPLLFDEQYKPKPAYCEIKKLFQ